MTDAELVTRCLKGDETGFVEIIDRYLKVILNIAYRMGHRIEDAEDIAQGVFIKVYENLDRYNPRYKFFSWLYRIAVNESINALKKQQGTITLDPQQENNARTPDEQYDFEAKNNAIHLAIAKLKNEYRIIIILKHLQELSYAEIAEILEIPEKTVKSRLYTARQLLRDILIKNGVRFG